MASRPTIAQMMNRVSASTCQASILVLPLAVYTIAHTHASGDLYAFIKLLAAELNGEFTECELDGFKSGTPRFA
jgi:hypothetical protein